MKTETHRVPLVRPLSLSTFVSLVVLFVMVVEVENPTRRFFTWAVTTVIPAGLIKVDGAAYGGSCGAPPGNATKLAKQHCDGRNHCKLDVSELSDPAPGCLKDFVVNWTCNRPGAGKTLTLAAEANSKPVATLMCPADPSGR